MFLRFSLFLKLHTHPRPHPRPDSSTSPSERIQRYPLSSLKCHIPIYGCLVSTASRPCSTSSFTTTPFTFTGSPMLVCSIFVCSFLHSCFSSHVWCNYEKKIKTTIYCTNIIYLFCVYCVARRLFYSK